MKRSDQRSNWEATIWEATAINSDVFKKPVISQAISLEHTRSQPKFHSTNQEPQGVRIKIIGHSNTANDCGHSTWPTSTEVWPSESEYVSQSVGPRHHRARSWGRLQMIGIRTTTNVNDIDRRRGSPSTGGDQLQKPSLQELQHQSTLKARLRQSFQARLLFRTPSFQPRATTSGVRFDHRLQDRPSFEHRDHRESNWDVNSRTAPPNK